MDKESQLACKYMHEKHCICCIKNKVNIGHIENINLIKRYREKMTKSHVKNTKSESPIEEYNSPIKKVYKPRTKKAVPVIVVTEPSIKKLPIVTKKIRVR
jgi:hypothetical protein